MCGIAGIIDFSERPINKADVLKMLRIMKHRGPDDEGIFINAGLGLGHVRLSIIDLSQDGHQPFFSKDNRYVVIYNGEIYNYLELREQLERKGHNFYTKTDTEVLLNSYIEWGEDCLNKFNGMWAFCIYDNLNKILFGARDRYGIKPLYYYYDGVYFIFASDIPPILSQISKKPNPNKQIIFDYLAYNRTDHSEDTFFSSIKKIQHGHSFHLNLKRKMFFINRWYDLSQRIGNPFNSSLDFLHSLQTSILMHMRSDVPVGVCLSGGLDSSTIVSLLKLNLNKEKIKTFSAIYNTDHISNEKKFIDLIEVKNKYFTYPNEDGFINDLSKLVEAQSEPFPTTAVYAQFKVMELAKQNVTVLLDGQGADEYLAGYHYFFGYYFLELLKNNKYLKFLKEISSHLKYHSFDIGMKYLIYLLSPRWIQNSFVEIENISIKKNIFNRYIATTLINDNLFSANSLNEACLNHFEYKLEHLLKWEDRNSMFFSIESRVPFLDFNIVERVLAGPTQQKIDNGFTKSILRDAMKHRLNDSIRLRREKVGFSTPEDIWIKSDVYRKLFQEAISSKSEIIQEFLDKKKMNTNIGINDRNARNTWKWINLYLWEKKYLTN
jgi:asparagine synthase (glutamine-hydrolysing)